MPQYNVESDSDLPYLVFLGEGFYGEREYSPLNMQIHYLGFLFFCAFVRKRSF